MSLARYYAWLSRFQDAAQRAGHDSGGASFTVHRRLRGDDGQVSAEVLHHLLLDALAGTDDAPPRDVLDAGCGLGGTLLFLHAALGARGIGLTLSPDQQARAAAEATRRGIGDAVRVVVRDYDADLTDLIPTGVDLVVAIESLAHAPDPAATVARLAARLRPSGRLVIVDDVPVDTLAPHDADYAAFRSGWMCPAILTAPALGAAVAAAGLTVVHDRDLTSRLPHRAPLRLAALITLTQLAGLVLAPTPARVLAGAWHGGARLERLYRRGAMRYRLLVARRLRPRHTSNRP